MKRLRDYILEELEENIIKLNEADDLLGGDDSDDGGDDSSDSDDGSDDGEEMKPVPDADKKQKREEDAKQKERADIKFTIWKSPDKKLDWLEEDDDYQKIEYKYENNKENLYVDFLLGKDNIDGLWKLWVGKIGACSYDDDPYCSLKTKKFNDAMINALDKVQEMLEKIKDDKLNYIQFYKNL